MKFLPQASDLQDLISLTPEPLLLLSPSGEIKFANAAAQSLFRSEVAGTNIAEFIPSDERLKFQSYLTRCTGSRAPLLGAFNLFPNEKIRFKTYGSRLEGGAHGEIHLGLRLERTDKNKFSVLSHTIHQLNEQVRRRMLSDDALRKSEQRLRQILDNVTAFIGLLDADGVLVEANIAAIEAAGVMREDLVGKRFEETAWWAHSPEIQEAVHTAVARALGGETVRADLEYFSVDKERRWVDFQAAPVFSQYGKVIGVVPSGVDITARRLADEHRDMLVNELNHRVNNTLATVQAIASHTMRSAANIEEFRETFFGRLRAIASAHEILLKDENAGADLESLIASQVGPYAEIGGTRLSIKGTDIILNPFRAHALGLVLHELATNASKYGALSNREGRVKISWKVIDRNGSPAINLDWREQGGPKVINPERVGFGSRLIEQTLNNSLGGAVKLNFPAEGFHAAMTVPLEDDYGATEPRSRC